MNTIKTICGTYTIHTSSIEESDFELRVAAMEADDNAYESMMAGFYEEEEAYYENRKGELVALDGYNPCSIELDDDMPF